MSSNSTNERYLQLAEKWRDGTITQQELKELDEWYHEMQLPPVEIPYSFAKSEKEHNERILIAIRQKAGISRKVVPIRIWKRLVAAAVVGAIGLSVYYALTPTTERSTVAKTHHALSDATPAKDGATLTLGNGRTIVLDDAPSGKITDVAIKDGNRVAYISGTTNAVELNTMATKRGRQFRLVLPDGSQAWLNAASSITFPTAFNGKDRQVSVTGEVYFEVAHDPKKPFHVSVNGADIAVLGTHFNVNSYEDEALTTTTLLEGSVRITRLGKQALLRPGQQAAFDVTKNKLTVHHDLNVDDIMAWKNGFFSFNNTDIKTVMRQLSRWYDVDVVFQGNVHDEKLDGKIPRNINVSAVLAALQYTGIEFKVEGKKIFVTP